MDYKKLNALFERYADQTASESEKKQVETFFDNMQKTDPPTPDYLQIGAQMKSRLNIRRRWFGKRMRVLRTVAAAVVALGIGCYFLYDPLENISATTAMAERREIALPDGSCVTLNGNSSLEYHSDFAENRQLRLTGEAFFEVKKDRQHPFVVLTGPHSVKVLGTSFNINASRIGKTAVTVATGKVSVRNKSGKTALLTPDQQAILTDSELTTSIQRAEIATSWMRNIIILQHNTLAETAEILKNEFGSEILLASDLKTETISGKFNNENLDTILKAIALVKDLEVIENTKNSYTIRRKNQQTQP